MRLNPLQARTTHRQVHKRDGLSPIKGFRPQFMYMICCVILHSYGKHIQFRSICSRYSAAEHELACRTGVIIFFRAPPVSCVSHFALACKTQKIAPVVQAKHEFAIRPYPCCWSRLSRERYTSSLFLPPYNTHDDQSQCTILSYAQFTRYTISSIEQS